MADSMAFSDLCAGWAVGKGALHAGLLSKRSQWLGHWNSRFFILTCDELVWFKSTKTDQISCSSWHFSTSGERRSIDLHAALTIGLVGGGLAITGPGISGSLVLRAASEAELASWNAAINNVLTGLTQHAQAAFAFVRERASLFSSHVFVEHPHCGSRNHLERAVKKTYYTVAPAKKSGSRRLGALFGGGGSGGGGSGSESDQLILSLTTLPAHTAGWTDDQCAAFLEVLVAIAESNHPCLLSPAHVELLPAGGKCATVRPLLPVGSIKDLVGRVHDPRQRYSIKYARLAAASDAAPAGASDELFASSRALGGSQSSAAVPPQQLTDGGGGGGTSLVGLVAQPLPAARIALFGRQVLEALRFLRACGGI